MRTFETASAKTRRWEVAAALVLLVCAAWDGARLLHDGYAPQPFYYLPAASFMDLHSTAFWAHHPGAYAIWRSIYPPLAFDLLKIFTLARCYAFSPEVGRDCDWLGRAFLTGVFLLNIFLLWRIYRRIDPTTAPARTAMVGAGLPMLYALERGNLLIPCFTAFILGAGPLLKRPFGRWLALAFAVNLKPYLLAVILPAAARRDWRWLIGFGATGLALYLATWAWLGAGSPWELIADTVAYAPGKAAAPWANLYYATSYWPLARALNAGALPSLLLAPGVARTIAATLVGAMRLAQAGAVICFLAALARPARVDAGRFLALWGAMILATITNGSAGYATIFLLFLIGLEPARGPLRITLLVAAWLLSLPVDVVFGPISVARAWSFLGDRWVEAAHGLALGQLLRPGLLLVVVYLLIALNFGDSLQPLATAAIDTRRPPE